jgi:hypothetical protein
MRNGRSKNGENDALAELLAGLDPTKRVQFLGELLDEIKVRDQAKPLGERLDARPAEKPSPPPSQTASDGEEAGRDKQSGRFTAGNSFSKGNPFSRRLAGMRAVLCETVDAERLRRIAAKLADLAEGGDLAAIQLLVCKGLRQGHQVRPFAIASCDYCSCGTTCVRPGGNHIAWARKAAS